MKITALRCNVVRVATPATRRDVYLRRPDLGRRLEVESAKRLDKLRCGGFDIAVVVADRLSSRAVTNNAVPLLSRLIPKLADVGLTSTPVVIAVGARVALGDEIAERRRGRLALVLIGERPGLSSPDSLGAYLTYAPRPGLTDAERNCVSNIRAGGLDVEAASSKLVWLVMKAFNAGVSGVQLKDESEACGRLSLADLARNRDQRCPTRRMFMRVIQNHPHRAGSHLGRELVRCLACHGSTLLKSWSLRQTRGRLSMALSHLARRGLHRRVLSISQAVKFIESKSPALRVTPQPRREPGTGHHLGSGLIDQSQKATAAAIQIADK